MHYSTYALTLYFICDIIVAGAFGFLTLTSGTETISGNFGIMDQQLALKWVQKNIGNFGGDPRNVVLWGQSAGAMSVGIHMQSPLSTGLFHKAIQESNPTSIRYHTPTEANDYAMVRPHCRLTK